MDCFASSWIDRARIVHVELHWNCRSRERRDDRLSRVEQPQDARIECSVYLHRARTSLRGKYYEQERRRYGSYRSPRFRFHPSFGWDRWLRGLTCLGSRSVTPSAHFSNRVACWGDTAGHRGHPEVSTQPRPRIQHVPPEEIQRIRRANSDPSEVITSLSSTTILPS